MPASADVFGARILIVDDSLSNLRLLDATLRRGGYVAVTTTANSLEVCALHRKNRYDLILLDLQMPGMNGFEVMAALKNEAAVSVLVLSADPAQMVRVMEAGASDFLSKPFVLAEVLSRVQLMLERPVITQVPSLRRAGKGSPQAG
jgi:DNA-binding response OmpR family regulator